MFGQTITSMCANSSSKILDIDLSSNLNSLGLKELSRTTGFRQRNSGKICSESLITSGLECLLQGRSSLSDWATQLGFESNKQVSKQAVSARLNERFCTLLAEILARGLDLQNNISSPLSDQFNHVIQDSTILHLPDHLFKFFPGNFSRGKRKAAAKLQVAINTTSGSVCQVDLTNFCKNDQSEAYSIIKSLPPKSLLIRDLGYFSLGAMREITQHKSHFLSRLKSGVKLFELQTNKPINLLKELKYKQTYKKRICVGKSSKLELTLVAIKLPKHLANERRRKMKNDRDKRLAPSKERLKLADWNLFITSLEPQTICSKDIAKFYRMRWHIEIVFKSWKSHLGLYRLLPKTAKKPFQAKAIIFLLMIYATMVQLPIYYYFLNVKKMEVSIIKLTRFLANYTVFIFGEEAIETIQRKPMLIRHAKRKRQALVHDFLSLA